MNWIELFGRKNKEVDKEQHSNEETEFTSVFGEDLGKRMHSVFKILNEVFGLGGKYGYSRYEPDFSGEIASEIEYLGKIIGEAREKYRDYTDKRDLATTMGITIVYALYMDARAYRPFQEVEAGFEPPLTLHNLKEMCEIAQKIRHDESSELSRKYTVRDLYGKIFSAFPTALPGKPIETAYAGNDAASMAKIILNLRWEDPKYLAGAMTYAVFSLGGEVGSEIKDEELKKSQRK